MSLYDIFINNITGFINDIQYLHFFDAINKDDRLLILGILLIVIALLMFPLIN